MKVWNSFPMLRVIPPFLIGVVSTAFMIELIIWDAQALVLFFSVLAALVLVGLIISAYGKNRPAFGIAVWLVMVSLGSGLTLSVSDHIYDCHISSISDSKYETYIIRVDDEPIVKMRSVKVTAEVTNDSLDMFGRVLFYFKRDSVSENLHFGQIIAVNSKLQLVENQGNPNEFNYRRYLRFYGISNRGYVKSNQFRVLSEPDLSIQGRLFSVRKTLIEKFEMAGLGSNELAVASALILGYRAELDKELMSAYAGAGATHVLAVSGLHVGIVYVILNFLLKFMDKKRSTKIGKTLILIFLLFGYAGLTGLSASVFRAATMFSFVAIGKALKRDTNIFNTLAASAFCLIAYEPMIIMQVGFQLSYAAVIGIVLIQPRLFKLYVFNNRLLDWAWSITCVSIAAQIATFPLGLLYFHQFPNLFLLSNLLVIPAATGILYLGFSLFVFSFWEPSLKFFGLLLDTTIHYLNLAVQQIESIPHSVLTGIDISIAETVMIYLVLSFTLSFMALKSRKSLYGALFVGCIFIGLQINEVYQQQNQKFITIYNVKGETAIALFHGTNVKFISSKGLFDNKQSMLFHIQHHWWNRGVERVGFIQLNDSILNRRLTWDNNHFVVCDLETNHDAELSVNSDSLDFAVLHDISWEQAESLGDLAIVHVILTNRYGSKTKSKLIESNLGVEFQELTKSIEW